MLIGSYIKKITLYDDSSSGKDSFSELPIGALYEFARFMSACIEKIEKSYPEMPSRPSLIFKIDRINQDNFEVRMAFQPNGMAYSHKFAIRVQIQKNAFDGKYYIKDQTGFL